MRCVARLLERKELRRQYFFKNNKMCSTLIRESLRMQKMYKNVPGGKIFLFGVDGNGVDGVDG